MDVDRRAKVFVSHSAEPDAVGMLNAVETGLREAGYDVLLDRTRLQGGDDWRGEVGNWIEECHAGLIVVSVRAVTRPWVIFEASQLMQRRRSQLGFTVIPIFVPPASEEIIRNDPAWDPVNLTSVQALTAADADELLADLRRLLEPVLIRYGARSPTYDLELELAEKLRSMSEQGLDRAAEEIPLDLTGWVRGTDKPLALARGVLGADLDALYRFAYRLIRLSLDPTRAVAVYDAAVPYAWVDPVAASKIAEISERPGRRAVGLNSAELRTCEMYVRRANHEWKPETIQGGWSEQALDEAVAWTRRALRKASWGDEEVDVTDADLNAELARDRYFVIVPAPLPDAELAAALLRAFPSVTFLFLAGSITQDDFAARGLSDVDYLLPELDRVREAEVLLTYSRDLGKLQAAG